MDDLNDILGSAFPFHIVVDEALRVTGAGCRLTALVPGEILGRSMSDILEIERPARIHDRAGIVDAGGALFILGVRDTRLRLRGQFFPYRTGDSEHLLFLGHPWINSLDDLQGQSLRLSDFPPHAGIADMLVLLQTSQSGLRESERLAGQLREAAGKLAERNEQLTLEMERRARTEEHVLQSQKMEAIGQLAGGVAHDLNNILLAITGHVSMALRQLDDREKVRGNLDNVLAASQRASELTSRLLAFGRRQVLNEVDVSVEAAFRELEQILEPLLGERVRLTVACDPGVGSVHIDSVAFQQVLLNLAINSRDAFPDGEGSIGIRADTITVEGSKTCLLGALEPGSWIRILVRDDGAGIAPEILDRVFEPFFTTKRQGEGTGLGLSTVWWVIERSGGALDVVSPADGGTEFTLYLRSSGEVRSGDEADRKAESAQVTGRILLVEDEEMVRQPVVAMLELLGWEVVEASSAEGALELVCGDDDASLDLVLTDMVMPGLGGRDLAVRLRETRPELPVLFMTGYDPAGGEDPASATESIIGKPFGIEELETFLAEAMRDR